METDNHPMGWPLLYETPLEMFYLCGKEMDKTVSVLDKTVFALGRSSLFAALPLLSRVSS